ncbi:MAG TPA: TonB-dependent receptor [Steroidobacteraceae bacterium]|nr:TonB-dependent receptor [Steroidobacteraceae bacterium]
MRALRQTGVDVIYSSELVRADMPATPAREGASPLQRARDALATQDLELRALGPHTYVVIRKPAPALPGRIDEPMQEVSVYASRYAIEGGLAEPHEVSPTDMERAPGSHDDALRSLQSLPGVVSAASARPYIRGSLSEDVLVRYDGIPLLDPFHLKNFQSLISAIDPAAVERIEVFSGGFPVRYGTRSGGVIDITAPNAEPGRQYRANLSFISGGASTQGRADSLPVEWLAAIRRSTLDMLDPVEDGFGEPQFGDSVGRIRWSTDHGAWTAGWLLLDDRLKLGTADDEERANARYRDEYVWLARDNRFGDSLSMRTSLVVTSAERQRDGTLQRPGVAVGELDEHRGFNGLEFSSDWTYARAANSTYSFGVGFATTRADYHYARHSEFTPEVAAAFDRDLVEDLALIVSPDVNAFSLYAANRRQWARFEAELGLRADVQHYENFGNHTQVSPRLNVRYDVNDRARAYASVGRFTQAQHVEEWRVEDAQQAPDAAQVSVHSILGYEYTRDSGLHLGIEAYSKRWTTVAPYFDNRLDPFALLPDLAPDRVRVHPLTSEARGLEVSLRRPFSERLTGWGTFTWARVADDFADSSDVLRSWDQPVSLSAGVAWKSSRAGLSAVAGFHSGWPRTPLSLAPLEIGRRNTARWENFYSLDLRGSWTWQLRDGDLSAVLDVTNATDRRNPCCVVIQAGPQLSPELGDWLPALVNLGFTYRWRSH